ncbi:MAG TPA: DUF4013 domain-containing protein [Verrucomicrobiales bacterium]|nr:DUF4013 domain-containing protein [Verrucomicrobiales bacterium]
MQWIPAVTDFFRTKNWAMNLLLASVCVLIPIIGPIVLLGWCVQCFLAWHEGREHPDLDFNLFLRYLMWGLWPFLVWLVMGLGMVLLLIPAGLLWIMIPAFQLEGFAAAVVFLLGTGVSGLLYLGMCVLFVPIAIRAALMQDFAAGFSPAFVRDFLKKTGVETLLVEIVLIVASIVGTVAGYLCLIIGVYPATALLIFAMWRLFSQLYALYLERGGTPVVISLELRNPPAVPPAPGSPVGV